MEKKNFGDYYLGLDMGSDSVGWAVTDSDYRLMKLNGKALWGIRLFPAANTAEDRRLFRSARRRLQRRHERLMLLQELFADDVGKVDPGFFLRLKESKYWEEDKTVRQKHSLFSDQMFTDKHYHKAFPTIYHLRKALIVWEKNYDIRLVYLAIHHILKSRGHFLLNDSSVKNGGFTAAPILTELKSELFDELGIDWTFADTENIQKVLKDSGMTVRDKAKQLLLLLGDESNRGKAVADLLAGAKVDIGKIFGDEFTGESDAVKISFKDADDYDSKSSQMEETLGDLFYCLEKLRAVYNSAQLADLMQGEPYLSFAKVNIYAQHARDLKALKETIRKYGTRAQYEAMFTSPDQKDNYCAYVGLAKRNGKKIVLSEGKCSQDALCKRVQALLKDYPANNTQVALLLKRAESGNLMPKIVSKDNSVIPTQLHRRELEVILQNAAKVYPFLTRRDESGLSQADKILSVMSFRIPYYVGPLNSSDPKGKNAWVVRTQEKLYPWNFDLVVDKKASAEKFIIRITSFCTYLHDAPVLPRQSLLYSKFIVLNELNNLTLHGEKITVDLKQHIYKDLFMQRKKVTRKALVDYLNSIGKGIKAEDIGGVDGDFKASLSSLIDMDAVLGVNYDEHVAEEIIRILTVFGSEKSIAREKLLDLFGDSLTAAQADSLASQGFTGWGSLSGAFLTEIWDTDRPDPATGELDNIISALWKTNNNLMQLLGRDHAYTKKIDAYNADLSGCDSISYKAVSELYVSPSVKRQIWQSLAIVREIRKFMGHDPKRIFLEVAREEGKKVRTVSRKNALADLYKSLKEEGASFAQQISRLEDRDFRRDRLYLYYIQRGKCMYTGAQIDLDKLFDDSLYDIDHIYPQSKVFDDSLDNRVLVSKQANQSKSDKYPLDEDVRKAMRPFWTMLQKQKLISVRKYERLTRSTPFTEQEAADFISRQLVETRQSTKAAASILKTVFPQSDIVYVKAGNVSRFRQEFDIVKVREVNDLHHARDAYLNIVVGNTYHTRFTTDPRYIIQRGETYSLKRLFDFDVARAGLTAWKAGPSGTITQVKNIVSKNNILFTRFAYRNKGGLFDTQIKKKGLGQLPVKSSDARLADISKYGGYNKIAGSYFFLVEHTVKGKRIRSLLDMPLHKVPRTDHDEMITAETIANDRGLVAPRIVMPAVKINSLFKIDGFLMHLTGRTGESLVYSQAQQLCLSDEEMRYMKRIIKFNAANTESLRFKKIELQPLPVDGISKEKNLEMYDMFTGKLENAVYRIRLAKQGSDLKETKDVYDHLTIGQQCALLGEVLQFFTCTRVMSDLSTLGKGKSAGVIKTSNALTNYGQALLIHQSPTGVFEQVLNLLTL